MLKFSEELKNGIEILVVFKLWIKTVKIMSWSITQEPLGLLKCHIWVPWTIYYKNANIIFQKGVDNFETEPQNMLIFG